MADLRVGGTMAWMADPAQGTGYATAMGIAASKLLVWTSGIISTACAIFAVLRMFDNAASTEEVILWIAAAWVAWSAVIAVEVLSWARRNRSAIERAFERG